MSINRVKKLAGLNESKIKRSDVSRVARDLEALQKMQEYYTRDMVESLMFQADLSDDDAMDFAQDLGRCVYNFENLVDELDE